MIASFLMGLAGGQRALTPLAAVSIAAARGRLPDHNGAPRILANPLLAAGAAVLAVGEMVADKQKTAPDRIALVGLAARFATSAMAGAALASREQRWTGAIVGGSTAVIASYAGWRARTAFIPRYGQTPTGLVEDALVVLAAFGILRGAKRGRYIPSSASPG